MLTYSFHISQFIRFPGKTQVWLNSYPEYIIRIIIKILGYFWGVIGVVSVLQNNPNPILVKIVIKERENSAQLSDCGID